MIQQFEYDFDEDLVFIQHRIGKSKDSLKAHRSMQCTADGWIDADSFPPDPELTGLIQVWLEYDDTKKKMAKTAPHVDCQKAQLDSVTGKFYFPRSTGDSSWRYWKPVSNNFEG